MSNNNNLNFLTKTPKRKPTETHIPTMTTTKFVGVEDVASDIERDMIREQEYLENRRKNAEQDRLEQEAMLLRQQQMEEAEANEPEVIQSVATDNNTQPTLEDSVDDNTFRVIPQQPFVTQTTDDGDTTTLYVDDPDIGRTTIVLPSDRVLHAAEFPSDSEVVQQTAPVEHEPTSFPVKEPEVTTAWNASDHLGSIEDLFVAGEHDRFKQDTSIETHKSIIDVSTTVMSEEDIETPEVHFVVDQQSAEDDIELNIQVQQESTSAEMSDTEPDGHSSIVDDTELENDNLIVVPGSTLEQLYEDHLSMANTYDSKEEYLEALRSDPTMLNWRIKNDFYNQSQSLNREAVELTIKSNGTLSKAWKDETGKVHGSTMAGKRQLSRMPDGNSTVSGDDAMLFVSAMTNGVRRLFLPNSGFYMNLKAPLNVELDTFYKSSFRSYFEHGKTFGQYFFIPADLSIRKLLLEFLPKWITKCNLQGWNVGDRLLKSIKAPDYDIILWAIATLMHPNGVNIDFYCANQACPSPKQTLHVDLDNICFINHTGISLEAKRALYSLEIKTDEQLAEYQKMLNLTSTKKLVDRWHATFEVPSLFDVMEYGTKFNADLETHIQVTDAEAVTRYIGLSMNQTFVPWISKLFFKDDTTNKIVEMSDRAQFPQLIGQLQTAQTEETKNEFFNAAKEYIASTKLSHIGYLYDSCPVCNKIIPSSVGGIIPCDVQTTFFYLSAMKLNSL